MEEPSDHVVVADATSVSPAGSEDNSDLVKPVKDDVDGLTSFDNLKRNLRNRHLQMIAIGGTIGSGLFLTSGASLANAGPAGALLGYMVVGVIVYSVVLSLGEIATYIPIAGGFNIYTARFVDPSLGFAMGWIYWFNWAITCASELTACGLVIQYWDSTLSAGVPITIFWIGITFLNLCPVQFYGELEFWMSFLKFITCVGFILFSICVIFGAGDQGFIGLKTWTNPGAFAPHLVHHEPLGSFLGFYSVLVHAGFSYLGTELIAVTAGEAADPTKSIPAAAKKTFLRIVFVYVGVIFFIGAQVPYTNPRLLSSHKSASNSSLVIAAELAGVTHLAGLINAVILIAVVSAANSDIYSASRLLIGLANQGMAPQFFKKTNRYGVPYIAVAFCSAWGLLAFLNLSVGGSKLFLWLANISAVAGFITWACINASHIGFQRALKAQGISRDSLPYKVRWQPWFSWVGLCGNIIIIGTQGFTAFIPWNVSNFFAAYISVFLFIILYIGHKFYSKSKFVDPAEADLKTGCVELDNTDWEAQRPKTFMAQWWERFS